MGVICAPWSGRVFVACGRRSCRMRSRETILGSIRSHLAARPLYNPSGSVLTPASPPTTSVVDLFKQNVEAVDGHCVMVQNEEELTRILENFATRKIAISDAP